MPYGPALDDGSADPLNAYKNFFLHPRRGEQNTATVAACPGDEVSADLRDGLEFSEPLSSGF